MIDGPGRSIHPWCRLPLACCPLSHRGGRGGKGVRAYFSSEPVLLVLDRS